MSDNFHVIGIIIVIIGIVLLIIGIIQYEIKHKANKSVTGYKTPGWIWAMIIAGPIFIIIGAVVFYMHKK